MTFHSHHHITITPIYTIICCVMTVSISYICEMPRGGSYDETRAMMDALMGAGRDGGVQTEHKYSDDAVCREHLEGCCKFDLFTGTKIDYGTCPNVHDPALVIAYQKDKKAGEANYERDVARSIQPVLDECARKIQRADVRLREDGHPEDKRIVDVLSMIVSPESAACEEKVKAKRAEIDSVIAGGGTSLQTLPLQEELEDLVQARAMAEATAMMEKGFGKADPADEIVTPEMMALDDEVKAKLEHREKLGEEGEIDASMAVGEEVEALKAK